MASKAIVWRGPRELVQQKLKWSFGAEAEELIVPFEGPLSVALAKKPKIGSKLLAFQSTGMQVNRVEIDEGDADSAVMKVFLGAPKAPDADISTQAVGDPIYELRFNELEKPIEAHPNCGTLKPDRPDNETLKRKVTWDDWPLIKDADYEIDLSGSDPWDLATYRAKKEAGIDSFLVAYPTVRRTIYFLRSPGGVGAGCYEKENPPSEADAPSQVAGTALTYIKTTESLVKQGRLRTLTTEWTGVWGRDADLYP